MTDNLTAKITYGDYHCLLSTQDIKVVAQVLKIIADAQTPADAEIAALRASLSTSANQLYESQRKAELLVKQLDAARAVVAPQVKP